MPWNNQSGGAGGNGDGQQGPWSRGPSSGGTGGPPDIEGLLKRGQERLRQLVPREMPSPRTFLAIGAGLVFIWLLSGIYFVSSHEQGFVMRFGRVTARSAQGINYHLPWPIETYRKVAVGNDNVLNVGYRPSSEVSDQTQAGDNGVESLMLTSDQNIVDVNFSVHWIVKDVSDYLFNVENLDQKTDEALRAVAESAMREVVGTMSYDAVNPNRAMVESRVRQIMQRTLDAYGAGIEITGVKLVAASEPPQVSEAFRRLQSAESDQAVKRSDAEAYANARIPEARGRAAQIVEDAQAYRQQAIAQANGQAKEFRAVLQEYRKAPDVTRRRMYIETMTKVLAPMNKVILDGPAGRNVVPYLQLPGFEKSHGDTPATKPVSPQISAGPTP